MRSVLDGDCGESLVARKAYMKTAGAWLAHSRNRLTGLVAAIEDAVTTGRAVPAEKLERARWAVESHLQVAEERLQRLQMADISEWEERRDAVDDAREDLSRSIRHLLARLACGKEEV